MEKFSLKAFSSATQEDSIKFGWKAVRQALLSKAGFRVPEGFLLYVKDWNSIGEAYTQAMAQFPEVMRGSAIMRSSAAGEDGTLTYAGVFDSEVFDGCLPESFERAAKKLLASYASETARLYAERNAAASEANLHLTALVQRMLQPSCSGVAYSHDPVTGLAHGIIESTYGVSLLLTDGKISPDYVQLDEHGEILIKRTGKKQRLVQVENGGLIERPATTAEAQAFSISDGQIHKLWTAVRRIQAMTGTPQDIEWAFENGRLYILQNREVPVTVG